MTATTRVDLPEATTLELYNDLERADPSPTKLYCIKELYVSAVVDGTVQVKGVTKKIQDLEAKEVEAKDSSNSSSDSAEITSEDRDRLLRRAVIVRQKEHARQAALWKKWDTYTDKEFSRRFSIN